MAGYKADFDYHQGYLSDKFIEDLACRKFNLTLPGEGMPDSLYLLSIKIIRKLK